MLMSDTNPEILTARELATHASEIKHLQDDMDKLVSDMEEIKKAIVEIQKTLSEAKGGWRMLLAVGGAAGLVGSGITWLIGHWK
jgi:prefoldin subunit 5